MAIQKAVAIVLPTEWPVIEDYVRRAGIMIQRVRTLPNGNLLVSMHVRDMDTLERALYAGKAAANAPTLKLS